MKELSKALECIQKARNINPYHQEIINEEIIIQLEYHKFIEKEKQIYSRMFK